MALIGLDRTGRTVWERPTLFLSGTHQIDQRLIGASPDGLVLSSLEVWSPQTGETIAPASIRTIPSESRAVPLHAFTGAALYHSVRKTIFVFEADVTLLKSQGGLYEINASTGSKTLILPVVTTLLRGFDRIEEMALSPDGRFLYLAQQLSWRGPTDVSFVILDLSTNHALFLERFCHRTEETCADLHVVVGPKGAFGFSYSNLNRREHHLLMYQANW